MLFYDNNYDNHFFFKVDITWETSGWQVTNERAPDFFLSSFKIHFLIHFLNSRDVILWCADKDALCLKIPSKAICSL